MSVTREELAHVAARVNDAIAKSRRGEIGVLPFLTPRERREAEKCLNTLGCADAAWFYGGYPDAERVRLFVWPEYLLDMAEADPNDQKETDGYWNLLSDGAVSEAVTAIRISGSGFRVLSHRDYLGSILGLGVERDALGDVAVQNEHEAVVFCTRQMACFLCDTLTKVANDAVRCRTYTPDAAFTDGRHYQPIADTVASARLDCVVAALINRSREEAQGMIRTGLVEVDFEPTDRTDYPANPPQTISVRGYGRYVLRAFEGETRKGRLRMRADKLV